MLVCFFPQFIDSSFKYQFSWVRNGRRREANVSILLTVRQTVRQCLRTKQPDSNADKVSIETHAYRRQASIRLIQQISRFCLQEVGKTHRQVQHDYFFIKAYVLFRWNNRCLFGSPCLTHQFASIIPMILDFSTIIKFPVSACCTMNKLLTNRNCSQWWKTI